MDSVPMTNICGERKGSISGEREMLGFSAVTKASAGSTGKPDVLSELAPEE